MGLRNCGQRAVVRANIYPASIVGYHNTKLENNTIKTSEMNTSGKLLSMVRNYVG